MALYLAEGGDSDRLLGLTCRHVLISSNDTNVDYVYRPSTPARDVLLLGKRAFTNLVDSIKLRIGRHGIVIERWRSQIAGFEHRAPMPPTLRRLGLIVLRLRGWWTGRRQRWMHSQEGA